jgi:hypothetical protein
MERQVLRLPKPDADGLSMGEKRADERTRTADLVSLRVGCYRVRVVPRRPQKPINKPFRSLVRKS